MTENTIRIPLGPIQLEGELIIPKGAKGIVLFAHGSGSGRFSPRNQFVAAHLQKCQLATLLIDLLTAEEERIDDATRALRFDIPMLAERLIGVSAWLHTNKATASLPLGYFGASTGAAAALIAATKHKPAPAAVVSRGGRPDLAADALPNVTSPTMLIVGGDDTDVIALNQQAYAQLSCPRSIQIIPGATHLFEEPGTLEEVAEMAGGWFVKHLH